MFVSLCLMNESKVLLIHGNDRTLLHRFSRVDRLKDVGMIFSLHGDSVAAERAYIPEDRRCLLVLQIVIVN